MLALSHALDFWSGHRSTHPHSTGTTSHTHLRQTDEWNNFYPIRLAVVQPTRARHSTSHTHLRQTDEWNNFYPIRLAILPDDDDVEEKNSSRHKKICQNNIMSQLENFGKYDAKKDGYDAECEEEVGKKNFHFHRYRRRRRRSIDRSLISYYHLTSDTHTRCTLAISIAIQLPTYHEALVLQLPLLLLPRVVVIIVAQQQQQRQQQPCVVLGLCAVDDIMAIASIAAAVTVTLPIPAAAAATITTWHGGGQ